MIIQKVPHYVDSVLTQEVASAALQGGDVVVAWYTNQANSQSVVHSHPYYELILPVAGSSVRYSVGGSVYDLHLGELILFPGEMYHSCKFNITADTSERLVGQIGPGLWDRACRAVCPAVHGTATPSSWMQTPSCTGISAACWNGWHRLSHWTKGYAPSCNAAR